MSWNEKQADMRFRRSGMAAKPSTNGIHQVQAALDVWAGRTVQVTRPDGSQFVTSYLALEDAQRLTPPPVVTHANWSWRSAACNEKELPGTYAKWFPGAGP